MDIKAAQEHNQRMMDFSRKVHNGIMDTCLEDLERKRPGYEHAWRVVVTEIYCSARMAIGQAPLHSTLTGE